MREFYVSVEIAIMAEDESTLDLPEQRDWKKPARDDSRLTRCERKHYEERIGRLTDRDYWNARARGMSGSLTSGSVEDLLGQRNSRYYGQTIFLHEFSHDLLQAIRAVDPHLYAEDRLHAPLLRRMSREDTVCLRRRHPSAMQLGQESCWPSALHFDLCFEDIVSQAPPLPRSRRS